MFMWHMLTCIYMCVCMFGIYHADVWVCMYASQFETIFLGKVFWEFSFIALSQLGRFRSIPVTDVFLQTNSKRFSLISCEQKIKLNKFEINFQNEAIQVSFDKKKIEKKKTLKKIKSKWVNDKTEAVL